MNNVSYSSLMDKWTGQVVQSYRFVKKGEIGDELYCDSEQLAQLSPDEHDSM